MQPWDKYIKLVKGGDNKSVFGGHHVATCSIPDNCYIRIFSLASIIMKIYVRNGLAEEFHIPAHKI